MIAAISINGIEYLGRFPGHAKKIKTEKNGRDTDPICFMLFFLSTAKKQNIVSHV